MGGIHLFYARNRPQKVNLLRTYKVYDFPMYMLVNADHQIIGYDAPPPSQLPWVYWAIQQASKQVTLAQAYKAMSTPAYKNYVEANRAAIEDLRVTQ